MQAAEELDRVRLMGKKFEVWQLRSARVDVRHMPSGFGMFTLIDALLTVHDSVCRPRKALHCQWYQ